MRREECPIILLSCIYIYIFEGAKVEEEEEMERSEK
jgi:hypothetical protein